MQSIDIVPQGLREDIPKRNMPPGALQRADDVMLSKSGDLRMRGCFAGPDGTLSNPPSVLTTAAGFGVVATEAASFQDIARDVFVYSETDEEYKQQSPAIPLSAYRAVKTRRVAGSFVFECDCAVSSTLKAFVWTTSTASYARLETLDGVLVAETQLGAVIYTKMRIVAADTGFSIMGEDSSNQLFLIELADDGTYNGPAFIDNVVVWDVAEYSGTAGVYVYQNSGNFYYGVINGTIRNSTSPVGTGAALAIARAFSNNVWFSYRVGANVTGHIASLTSTSLTTQTISTGASTTSKLACYAANSQLFVLFETAAAGSWSAAHDVVGYRTDLSASPVQTFTQRLARIASTIPYTSYSGVFCVLRPAAQNQTVAAHVLCSLGTDSTLLSGSSISSAVPLALTAQGEANFNSGNPPHLVVDGLGFLYCSSYIETSLLVSEFLRGVEEHPFTAGSLSGIALFSGAAPRFFDGDRLAPFYVGPPTIETALSAGSLTGTFGIRVTFESTMRNGMRYQSAASVATSVSPSSQNITVRVAHPFSVDSNVTAVVWMTLNGGTTYYRTSTARVTSTTTTLSISAAPAGTTEILYSYSEPDRYPPPAFSLVGVARRRFWGANGRRAYYTHQLSNTDFPSFCAQVFYIEVDDDITAIGEIDEQPVLFTADKTYILRGDGPDRVGAGNWTLDEVSPRGGCIEARSVVKLRNGLMWLSRRGIELMPAGGGVAERVGAAVEDTLASYPYVRGVACDSVNERVLFAVSSTRSGDTAGDRLVVFDYSTGAWFRWSPLSATDTYYALSNWPNGKVALAGVSRVYTYSEDTSSDTAGETTLFSPIPRVIIGELRPSGLNRAGRWGNITLLGSADAAIATSPLTVKVRYDGGSDSADGANETQWFSLGASEPEYGSAVGAPFQRQYRPRDSQSDSLTIELVWSGPGKQYRIHGISVEYEPEDKKTRLTESRRR